MIDETKAKEFALGIEDPSVPDGEKFKMATALDEYFQAEDLKVDKGIKKAFTTDTIEGVKINDDIMAGFGSAPEEIASVKKGAANTAWLSRQEKKPVDYFSLTLPAYQDAYAQQVFKLPKKSVTNDEFYNLIRENYKAEDNAHNLAFSAAARNLTAISAMNEFDVGLTGSPVAGRVKDYYDSIGNIHFEYTQRLAPYRTIIDQAANTIEGYDTKAEGVSDAFTKVAESLLPLPPKERLLVINAIGEVGAAAPKEKQAYLQKLATAMDREVEKAVTGTASLAESMLTSQAISLYQNIPEMQGIVDVAKNRRELQVLAGQVKMMAHSKINPIAGNNWWEETGIGVARMTPLLAATFISSPASIAIMTGQFRDEATIEAVNAGVSFENAEVVGAISAPFMATQEFISNALPLGKIKIPFIDKWLKAATTSVKSAAIRVATRTAIGTVTEISEEVMQTATPLLTQDLLSEWQSAWSIESGISKADWDERMPKIADIAEQTFGPALIVSFLMAGRISIADVKNSRALMTSPDYMVKSGIAPDLANQITVEGLKGNYTEVDKLFRKGFDKGNKATPEQIKEAKRKINIRESAALEWHNKARQDFGLGTPANIGNGKYQFTTPILKDGKGNIIDQGVSAQFDSLSEANEAWMRYLKNSRITIRKAEQEFLTSMVNTLEEKQGLDVALMMDYDMFTKQFTELFPSTTAQVEERIKLTGQIDGAVEDVSLDNATLESEANDNKNYRILGTNSIEQREGISVGVITLYKGGSLLDLIEESAEVGVKRLMSDPTSRTKLILQIRDVEAKMKDQAMQMGQKHMPLIATTDDDKVSNMEIIEAFSHIAKSYYVQTTKAVERPTFTPNMPLNLYLGSLQSSIAGMELKDAIDLVGEKTLNILYRAAQLKAIHDANGLNQDFVAALEKSVGLNVSNRNADAVVDTAADLAADAGVSMSMGRVTPAQDAEYLAAAKAGDLAKAQVMVDEAAKKAGYDVQAWHAGSMVDAYDPQKADMEALFGPAFYAANTAQRAKGFGKAEARQFMLKTGTLFDADAQITKPEALKIAETVDAKDSIESLFADEAESGTPVVGEDVWNAIKDATSPMLANDALISAGYAGGTYTGNRGKSRDWFVFDPSQIKSADPVTRDESGQVIPLSERFNEASPDINFSMGSADAAFSTSRAQPADTSNITEMPDGAQLVGPTTFSIAPKAEEDDSQTEPGELAPDSPVEDLPTEGDPIPWTEETSFSISPSFLPTVFPPFTEEIKNEIYKETKTIAAIHIDRMKVGEFAGVPLQGGMFYPSIVENLKAGVVWAFNADNIARGVARRAAQNGGFVKLILMQEGNVIGNKTFGTIWFKLLNESISNKRITKTAALAELNRVRELYAEHPKSEIATGHTKKWKTIEEAAEAIIGMPQKKRGATYFQKTKTVTKADGEKIAYQALLSKRNADAGFPDAIDIVSNIEEESFKGVKTGSVVGVIRFDPLDEAESVQTAEQAGVPEHLSYKYVLKGKPVARMMKHNVIDETFPATAGKMLSQQHTNYPVNESLSFSISPITPAQDAEYLAAVESGDVEKAQRLVDEAAKVGRYPNRVGNLFVTDKIPIPSEIKGYDYGQRIRKLLIEKGHAQEGFSENSQVNWNAALYDESMPENWDRWLDVDDQGQVFIEGVLGNKKPELVIARRRGMIPEHGTSKNLRENIQEKGVSVIEVLKPENQNKGGQYDITLFDKPDNYVIGWMLDPYNTTGGDNEPLLRGATVLGKVGKIDKQIKSADPVTYDNAGNVIPLSQRFNEASPDINFSMEKANRKNSLRVLLTKKALTDAALSQASWKDWYSEHKETLDEFFGDSAELFQKILSVTSQASSVKANVGLALKAFGQLMRGEEFDGKLRGEAKSGYLPAVISNLNAVKDNLVAKGRKISNYTAANEGDLSRVVVDRHIARLLFGVDTPSKSQYDKAEKILTKIANEIGWSPSQVQAALWAYSIVKSGETPESYGAYLKKLESKPLTRKELKNGLTGNQLTKRIGNITRGGDGLASVGTGRGRYSSTSPTFSISRSDFTGRIEQSLRPLFEGSPDAKLKIGMMALKRAQAISGEALYDVGRPGAAKRKLAEMEASRIAKLGKVTDKTPDWVKKSLEKETTPEQAKAAMLKDKLNGWIQLHDAIVSSMPTEIRGTIGSISTLVKLSSDEARLKFIEERIPKMEKAVERYLKKEYGERIDKMLESASVKGKAGEIPKSKFIVTVQDELNTIIDMASLSTDDTVKEAARYEAEIISAQTAEDAADSLAKSQLLEVFGDLYGKQTTAEEMDVAHEYLKDLMTQGRNARKIIDEARAAEIAKMVEQAKADAFAGAANAATVQAGKDKGKGTTKGIMKGLLRELGSHRFVLSSVFGRSNKTADHFDEQNILGINAFETKQAERKKSLRDFMRTLYGTKSKIRLDIELEKMEGRVERSGVTKMEGEKKESDTKTVEEVERIIKSPSTFGYSAEEAQMWEDEMDAWSNLPTSRKRNLTIDRIKTPGTRIEIPLSQMEAVYMAMALRQPGILEQQSVHGYDHITQTELEAFMSDDAKNWLAWFGAEYANEYATANEVFMRLFHTRMPQIQFYAPLLKNHQGNQASLDPLNSGVVSQSVNPGAVKSRRGRTSSLRIESALAVYQSHFVQMDYWVHMAEYLRDTQAVMLNADVQNAIRSEHGNEAMQTLSAWIQLEMARGVGKGALVVHSSKLMRNLKSGVAMKALAFNVGTSIKTLSSVFYSLGEIPITRWPTAFARGVEHWGKMWDTNIIQNRLTLGGTPEIRHILSNAGKSKNAVLRLIENALLFGSVPTQYADAVLTSYSAAMVYGDRFAQAKDAGAGDDAAHKYASREMEIAVSRTAQPNDWSGRSLIENDATGVFNLLSMFSSDPRQKLGLVGEAMMKWKRGGATNEETMRKVLAYWVIPGLMFQVANAVTRSLFKDDDKEWELDNFIRAAIVGPLQGLFLLGAAAEFFISSAVAAAAEKITGEKQDAPRNWRSSTNPMVDMSDQFLQSIKKLPENMEDEDYLGGAWQIMKAGGAMVTPFSPAGSAPGIADRVFKDTSTLFYGKED
jgi:hypothetical protein